MVVYRFTIACLSHAREQGRIENCRRDFFSKRFDGIFGAMIENETVFAVVNEIVETAEIGYKHGTTVRHRLERGQAKSLTALGQ